MKPMKAWRVTWASADGEHQWEHYFRRWPVAFEFAVRLAVDHGGRADVRQVEL